MNEMGIHLRGGADFSPALLSSGSGRLAAGSPDRLVKRLTCAGIPSVVSCRRDPPPTVLKWYADQVALDALRVPEVVREVRMHGIDHARRELGDEVTALSVEDSFGDWWSKLDPRLVVGESPAARRLADRLRAVTEIANMIKDESGKNRVRTSANLRIVATAVADGYGIATIGPTGFSVFEKYLDFDLLVLSVAAAR